MSERPPSYNAIFQKLKHKREDDPLLFYAAYGRYKEAKVEWASDIWEKNQRRPTPEELKQYEDGWTNSRLDGLITEAQLIIGTYMSDVIKIATPEIQRDALKGSWWRVIGLNLASAALYTLILIIIAYILKFTGIDLIDIYKNM